MVRNKHATGTLNGKIAMEADIGSTHMSETSMMDGMCAAIMTQKEVLHNLLVYVEKVTHQIESVHTEQQRQTDALTKQVKALEEEVKTLKNMLHNILHVATLVDN